MMKRKVRWNKAVFAHNIGVLVTMAAMAGLLVWLTCEWILAA